jgi:hypothetical protein
MSPASARLGPVVIMISNSKWAITVRAVQWLCSDAKIAFNAEYASRARLVDIFISRDNALCMIKFGSSGVCSRKGSGFDVEICRANQV